MTKEVFIETLAKHLETLPPSELSRAVSYYEEIIDDSIEEGLTEEDAVAALGDPATLARQLLEEYEEPRQPAKTAYSDDDALRQKVKTLKVDAHDLDVEAKYDERVTGVEVNLIGIQPDEIETALIGGAFALRETRARRKSWFMFGERRVELLIGTEKLDSIEWRSASGDAVMKGLRCRCAEMQLASGDLDIEDVACDEVFHIHVMSGDLNIKGFKTDELHLDVADSDSSIEDARCRSLLSAQARSGDFDLNNVECGQSIQLHALSGDISLRNVACGLLGITTISGDVDCDDVKADAASFKTTSGDMNVEDLSMSGPLSAESISGDISLEDVEAASVTLTAQSGDISAALKPAGSYRYEVIARHGDVDVPKGFGERLVKARVTMGDISISEN